MNGISITGHEGLADRMRAFSVLPIIESEAIRGIRVDTAQGKQPDGSAFALYVKRYAARRLKKGLRTSPVNLRVKPEDSLLDTLTATRTEVGGNESVISVKTDLDPIAQGLSRKRTFMGVSAGTELRIIQSLDIEFERMMG